MSYGDDYYGGVDYGSQTGSTVSILVRKVVEKVVLLTRNIYTRLFTKKNKMPTLTVQNNTATRLTTNIDKKPTLTTKNGIIKL